MQYLKSIGFTPPWVVYSRSLIMIVATLRTRKGWIRDHWYIIDNWCHAADPTFHGKNEPADAWTQHTLDHEKLRVPLFIPLWPTRRWTTLQVLQVSRISLSSIPLRSILPFLHIFQRCTIQQHRSYLLTATNYQSRITYIADRHILPTADHDGFFCYHPRYSWYNCDGQIF